MRRFRIIIAPWMGLVVGLSGCQHPEVTAVSLNPHYCDHKFAFLYDPCKEPEGIPFYLPKPLLIVAKNFRNVEETKVGLTDSAPIPNFYDDQAKYADLNARTNFSGLDGNAASGTPAATSGNEQFPTGDAKNLASVSTARVYSGTGAPISPGVVPSDGLTPDTFYTYHIVFVPDMTQKYGLKIKGGAGEIRAAMNLVNGWQFTGLGPYYMKDSSTAQNTLAAGITANLAASGVADVVKAVANLKPGATGTPATKTAGTAPAGLTTDQVRSVTDAMRQLHPRFVSLPAYAEISIYEPYISPEGTMEWKPIAEKSFSRHVLTTALEQQQTMGLLQSATGVDATVKAAQAGQQSTAAKPGQQPQAAAVPGQQPQAAAVPGQQPQAAAVPGQQPQAAAVPGQQPQAAAVPGQQPQATPSAGQPKAGPSRGTTPTAPTPKPPGNGDAAMDLSPLELSPSTMRGASGAGLRASVVPPPRRASIPTVQPGDSRTDDAIVRTQGTEAGPFLALDALAQAGATPQLRLSTAANSGRINDRVTSSSNPLLEVTDAPPDAEIQLFRDYKPVNTVPTGTSGGVVQVRDDKNGTVVSGTYSYAAFLVKSGATPIGLGPLAVQVGSGGTASNTPATPATTPAANAATTPAANTPPATPPIDRDLLRHMFVQAGVLPAASSPASGSVVATPTGASAGNQINLNQYFGKTKVAAPADASPTRRFSLFHRQEKSRPKVRTIDMAALETAATTTAPPSTPGAP